MPILKVYSEIDADLYIDFQKVCSIGSCQMIPITLDDGQYFVRLNTKNPLLYKEGIISLTGPQVFLAKKEDFLSKLTETQLSGLQFIKVREGKRVYIKELISGIPFSAAYESIGEFNEGICPVLANGKVGFIDRTCKEVIPCIYEDYDTINNGIICIKQYDKWGAINLNKEIIIPIIYDKCSECEDGFWSINKDGEWDYDMYGQKRFSGGRWGICDRNGKEIIPCKFSEIHSNGDGVFLCKGSLDSNGSDALFDSKGSELIPKNIISTIYPFNSSVKL